MNGRIHPAVTPLNVVIWSLPSLLSVLLFACMFPAGNKLYAWSHTAIAEVSFYWFLTITPLTTIVAVVRTMRFSRRKQLQAGLKALGWGLIGLSVTLNGIVLVVLSTAFYY